MLGSSRVVVSPRSWALPVIIFLRSLRMTFPERVFGRRFTIWQRRGTTLKSGKVHRFPACIQLRRALSQGIVGPTCLCFILLQSVPKAVINPKGRINYESCWSLHRARVHLTANTCFSYQLHHWGPSDGNRTKHVSQHLISTSGPGSGLVLSYVWDELLKRKNTVFLSVWKFSILHFQKATAHSKSAVIH